MSRSRRGTWRGCVALTVAMASVTGASLARADDTAKCVEAAEKAEELRGAGKLFDAKAQLDICGSVGCPALVHRDCTNWLVEVMSVLPTVVLGARDAKGRDVSDVRVTVDGRALSERLDGNPLPLDPGRHTFRFETKGFAAVDEPVVLRQGEKNRIVIVTFADSKADARVASAPTPADLLLPAPDAPSYWTGRRIGGIAVGAVGLVALGVGGAMALSARSQFDSAQGASGPTRRDESMNAANKADLATVFVVGGAAVAAAGVVVWLTAPSRKERAGSALAVGTNGRELLLHGLF